MQEALGSIPALHGLAMVLGGCHSRDRGRESEVKGRPQLLGEPSLGSMKSCLNNNNTWGNGASKMSQWVKGPTAEPNGMSLIPKKHRVEGKIHPSELSLGLHMFALAHTSCVHPCTYTKAHNKHTF